MCSRSRCQWSIAGEAFSDLDGVVQDLRAFNAGHPTRVGRYTRTHARLDPRRCGEARETCEAAAKPRAKKTTAAATTSG